MELRQLRYFVAICEEMSFSGAALRLRIAQPALSQQIKNLETELRVELLVRESRGVRPTAAGVRFLEHARQIVDGMAHAVDSARGAHAEPEGTVRFGMPGPVCEIIGVPLIESLKDRFPAVHLHIVEAMSGYVLEWLRSGRIDVALLYVTSETAGLPGETVFREDLHLIAPACTFPPLTREGRVAFKTVTELDLILPGRMHGLRRVLESFAKKAGCALSPVMETDSYGLMKQLVARGHGYCILPPGSILQERAAGLLMNYPIDTPSLSRDVAIAFASARPPQLVVTTVATACRETIGSLVASGVWQGAPVSDRHSG